jgi:hypothetical protein
MGSERPIVRSWMNSNAVVSFDWPRILTNCGGDPKTPDKDRKRMAQLLIEDVTLIKRHEITAHVRFKGGATRTLTLPLPLSAWQRRRLPANLIAEIDHLLDQHPPHEIAPILNAQGLHSIDGRPFNGDRVYGIACRHGLRSRDERMRATGLLTITEMAQLAEDLRK